MNKTKQFALFVSAAAMLVGTSAFAESRHSDATARDGERADRGNRGTIEQRVDRADRRDTTRSIEQQRTETRSYDNRSNDTRSYDRNRGTDNRSYDRNRGNDNRTDRSYDRNRGNDNRTDRSYDRNRGYDNRGYDRNRSYDRNRGYSPSYGRGNAYYHDGRVSRIERWNGGFRIYVGGAPYPFFVPEARFRLFPFRVGLSIHIGGYYNPLGYYDYYDAGPYGYGAGSVASAGALRGLVESVDYRRGSLVIRDDVSGQFVTVMMRGGDPRFDSLRTGDYVDLSGEWVRGYFQAYNVDRIDDGYYRR